MTTRRPVSAFASLKKGRNDKIHAHVSRINTHCKWIYPSPTNANLGRLRARDRPYRRTQDRPFHMRVSEALFDGLNGKKTSPRAQRQFAA